MAEGLTAGFRDFKFSPLETRLKITIAKKKIVSRQRL